VQKPPARVRLCVALALFTAAFASHGADPGRREPLPSAEGGPAPDRPLDLSIGDISRYVDAGSLGAPLPEELEEIVVWGRIPGPMPGRQALPQGLASIAYAVVNPLQAWRILMPDPNLQVPKRSEDDLAEPPGAHRGRILEPGRVYD
jgi:hypothetical protein